MKTEILTLLMILSITLFLFLICREVVCWYFKINVRVELQKETNNLLKQLVNGTKKNNSTYSEPAQKEEVFYGDPDELKKALKELKG